MIVNVIKELKSLSIDKLIQKWFKLFKQTPSQSMRKEFVIKHLAWEIQAKKQGGYGNQMKKKPESPAKSLQQNQDLKDENIEKLKSNRLTINPGTKLIREYQ